MALLAVVLPANEDAGNLASPPASDSRSDGVHVREHGNGAALGDNRMVDFCFKAMAFQRHLHRR